MRDIEAVIFDMDGLLLDTEPLSRLAWQAAAKEFDVVFSDALFLQILGCNRSGIERAVLSHYGDDFPIDSFIIRALHHYRLILETTPPEIKPGVPAFLEALNRLNIPCGVATSTGRDGARHKLGQAGLWERFASVTTGCEVVFGKPAPDIYLLAAQRLGKAPGRCLALEDSYNGVRAAHAAGCRTVMVPDLLPPNEEMASRSWRIADSLTDVCAWWEAARVS